MREIAADQRRAGRCSGLASTALSLEKSIVVSSIRLASQDRSDKRNDVPKLIRENFGWPVKQSTAYNCGRAAQIAAHPGG
jgi:hypothetical protein